MQYRCYKFLTLFFCVDISQNLIKTIIFILPWVSTFLLVTTNTFFHEGSPEHHYVLTLIILEDLNLPIILIF